MRLQVFVRMEKALKIYFGCLNFRQALVYKIDKIHEKGHIPCLIFRQAMINASFKNMA